MKKLIKILLLFSFVINFIQAEEIKLVKMGGVYSVPVMINDSVRLNFVIDSGAASVSMPYDVFRTLARTGTIDQKDILGKESYQMANGDIIEGTNINIRKMKIGNQVISNIVAHVDTNMNGHLLLGQSALQKLEPWHMDTKKEVIYIKSEYKNKIKKTDLANIESYIQSCDSGSSSACCALGLMHEEGKGVKQNYSRAEIYYKKACNSGSSNGCLSLLMLYMVNQRIKYNSSEVIKITKQACKLDNTLCGLVGKLYLEGIYIKPNSAKAKQYFKLACDAGYKQDCENVKNVKNTDTKKTIGFSKYVIKSGDFLYSIARENNTTMNRIREINGFKKGEILKIGRVLKLPRSKYSKSVKKNKFTLFTLKDITFSKSTKSYYELAEQCNKKADYKCAFNYSKKQLNEDMKMYPSEDKQIAKDYHQLGYYAYLLGHYKKALDYYFKSLKIKENILDKNDISIATAYNNIGLTYHKQLNYKEALTYYFKALKIQENVLGENDIVTAGTYNNIGITYNKQSRYFESLVYIMSALKIAQKELGENHEKTAIAYNNVAETYMEVGKYKIALEYYFKAMQIQEKLLGKNHPETAATYNNIGLVYNSQEKYEQALQYANKAFKIINKKLGEDHPTTKIMKNNITEMKINKALAKVKK